MSNCPGLIQNLGLCVDTRVYFNCTKNKNGTPVFRSLLDFVFTGLVFDAFF